MNTVGISQCQTTKLWMWETGATDTRLTVISELKTFSSHKHHFTLSNFNFLPQFSEQKQKNERLEFLFLTWNFETYFRRVESFWQELTEKNRNNKLEMKDGNAQRDERKKHSEKMEKESLEHWFVQQCPWITLWLFWAIVISGELLSNTKRHDEKSIALLLRTIQHKRLAGILHCSIDALVRCSAIKMPDPVNIN